MMTTTTHRCTESRFIGDTLMIFVMWPFGQWWNFKN